MQTRDREAVQTRDREAVQAIYSLYYPGYCTPPCIPLSLLHPGYTTLLEHAALSTWSRCSMAQCPVTGSWALFSWLSLGEVSLDLFLT